MIAERIAMNFAFFIRSKAVSALRAWALNLTTPRHQASVRHSIPSRAAVRVTPTAPMPVQRISPAVRPLRVVRVVERGQSRTDVGRMVISGRMADVCAELDRLVAREVAESCRSGRSIAVAC